jgi:ribose transport system substrate-binding protein
MITDEDRSELWQSVYESAQEEAVDADAYLELMQPGENEDYSQADYFRIAIASQADGIILQPDGSEEVRSLIEEATQDGIPVVTVLEDDSDSSRISFVGLNSYQMGEAYAEQALHYLKEENTEIMVLMNSASRDSGTNLIYSQIVRTLEQKKESSQTVSITPYTIEDTGEFTTEEAIRDIFLNQETLPDILICMDEVNTECAYQALLDYNKVGETDIIGFYYSDQILDAVQKGSIAATIALNSEEIGRYSVNALEEYFRLGYASNYYSVGLNVITQENAAAFITTDEEEEGKILLTQEQG